MTTITLGGSLMTQLARDSCLTRNLTVWDGPSKPPPDREKNVMKRKEKEKRKACNFPSWQAQGGTSSSPKSESGFERRGLMPHGSLVTTEHIPKRH